MAIILHIDASARSNRSLSRALSARFIEEWAAARPQDRVIRRDVGANPPSIISEGWIAAAFTDEADRTETQIEALKESDALVDEVLQAGVIVIGSSMYNYGMPAALKAWVDQVIRINRTFTFDLARGEEPIEPVQTGKTLVMLCAAGEGGFDPGGAHADMNHLDTHMRACMHLFGASEMHLLRIEYQEFKDDRHRASIEAAHAAIPALVLDLTAAQPGN